jgi:2-amino-4,5-dihydroxy-6-oxo-7-(phosphonooxy)heptanoate synthase
MNATTAHGVRLPRICRHGNRILLVPLDHFVTIGPSGTPPTGALVEEIVRNGADAVVLHKGAVRHVDPNLFRDTGLIVHLSASTIHSPDPDAKQLVATVEEAARLGADGVSVHVNLGSDDERSQLADLAAVASACAAWHLPLLVMIYPRGPRIANPRDPELIAHAVTLAVDLGADLVKTVDPGDVAALRDITRRCPVPLVVAGGPADPDEGRTVARVSDALRGGAAGVAMGRAIFSSPDPGAMTRKLADLIHGWQDDNHLYNHDKESSR